MRVKKFISVFLILVLSIQFLPIKQMISSLMNGQMSEELVHAKDSSKQNPHFDELQKHFLSQNSELIINLLISSKITAHHHAEALIARHADDIPTPPPNC